MIAIKQPDDVGLIAHPHIRALVEERFVMLLRDFAPPFSPQTHGWFLILCDGDNPQETTALGCPALLTDFDDVPYGQQGYYCPYEWCADHGDCFELVRVLSDGGEVVAVFIPKSACNLDLLKLCHEISTQHSQ